ncbi:MAG: FKBP-type peptidyl-prolyl cis-trans isomerase [Prevotellaceae bacterium]|jgi:FKBP-type peptidyl-prolyl cis-trans isomerase|nr:FKBP-type peptidyl-prolyl cis-trans isomerase [Prevotellaceae bacterium]
MLRTNTAEDSTLVLLKNLIIFSIIALLLSSCEKKVQIPTNKIEQKDSTTAEMAKLNRLLMEVEEREIKEYIENSPLHFKQSELGFWYAVEKQGTGQQIASGDKVRVEYEIRTIAGDLCYSFMGQNGKTFIVGKDSHHRGFHEALTLFHSGEAATVIVPSNLACGAMGDTKKIPPRAVLVYRVFSITTAIKN